MKGIILAGGQGTRLEPLTRGVNKHLLPVGNEPMIYNPISRMVEVGITKILIVTSTQDAGSIVNALGSGNHFRCSFYYTVQEQALGIAHALSLARDFCNGNRILVILGDNITNTNLTPYVESFRNQERGARVLLKKVNDPSRYGIAAIDEHHIIEIQEKPKMPKTNFAVVGYYMYDSNVFDIIRTIVPSARGEYEITTVNNEYIKRKQLQYDILEGNWTDAGTFESYRYANKILRGEVND